MDETRENVAAQNTDSMFGKDVYGPHRGDCGLPYQGGRCVGIGLELQSE